MKNLSRIFTYILLAFATGMFIWGVLGFLEYFTGLAPVANFQNSQFPKGTQFFHWLLITASGGTLLFGYLLRWKHTPFAMVVLFGMLATLCAIETFDFMIEPWRYRSFVTEVIMYIVMSTFLLKSSYIKEHFRR